MNEFRAARKLCELRTQIAAAAMGDYGIDMPIVDLSYIEAGMIVPSNELANQIFEFYTRHEKPPRFEGKSETVAELRERYLNSGVI